MLGCLGAPGIRSRTQLSLELYVPADGTRLPIKRTGNCGTSPIFVQLSDKQLACQYLLSWGIGTLSTMGESRNYAMILTLSPYIVTR